MSDDEKCETCDAAVAISFTNRICADLVAESLCDEAFDKVLAEEIAPPEYIEGIIKMTGASGTPLKGLNRLLDIANGHDDGENFDLKEYLA